jgi:hypothetical protein
VGLAALDPQVYAKGLCELDNGSALLRLTRSAAAYVRHRRSANKNTPQRPAREGAEDPHEQRIAGVKRQMNASEVFARVLECEGLSTEDDTPCSLDFRPATLSTRGTAAGPVLVAGTFTSLLRGTPSGEVTTLIYPPLHGRLV